MKTDRIIRAGSTIAGGAIIGATASTSTVGPIACGLLLIMLIASGGIGLLFATIMVSSGLSLSFLTGGERSLISGVGGATFDGIRLVLVLGGFAILSVLRPALLTHIRYIALYVVFLGLAALSILWSPDRAEGMRFLCKLVYPAAAFVLSAEIASTEGDTPLRKLICWAAVVSVGMNLLVALAGWSPYVGPGYENRYHGAFHPNPLGLFSGSCLLMLYAFWLRKRDWRYVALGLILAVQLVATGSRTSLIAVGAGLLTFEIFHRRGRRILVCLLLFIALWTLVPTFGTRTSEPASVTSELAWAPAGGVVNLSGRLVLWAEAWHLLIGDWALLGRGLGATEHFIAGRFSSLHDVHNGYLLILADTGVIGLVVVVGWLCGLFATIWRRKDLPYAGIALALLVMFALTSITEGTFNVYGLLPTHLMALTGLAINFTGSEQGAPA